MDVLSLYTANEITKLNDKRVFQVPLFPSIC